MEKATEQEVEHYKSRREEVEQRRQHRESSRTMKKAIEQEVEP
jgi:ribosomal protein L9